MKHNESVHCFVFLDLETYVVNRFVQQEECKHRGESTFSARTASFTYCLSTNACQGGKWYSQLPQGVFSCSFGLRYVQAPSYNVPVQITFLHN